MLKKIFNSFKPGGPRLGTYIFLWIFLLSALYYEESRIPDHYIIKCAGHCGSIWPILRAEAHPILEVMGLALFILPGILMVILIYFLSLFGLSFGFKGVSEFPEFLYFLILLFVLNWFPFCIVWKIIEVFVSSCEKTLPSNKPETD